LVFIRIRLRRNQVEPCRAVRRRNPYPPPTGLQNDIRNELKPKLVHIKLEALLHIANKDVNRLYAEIQILLVRGVCKFARPGW
jgi:hypothetical protein